VFSVLGFMAKTLNVKVGEVVTSGELPNLTATVLVNLRAEYFHGCKTEINDYSLLFFFFLLLQSILLPSLNFNN